jgi:hypothetical protein
MSVRGSLVVVLVSLVMVVSSMTGCLDGDDEEPDPVQWTEPSYLTIDRFEYIRGIDVWDLSIRLWDVDNYVTEWDGDLTIIIMDEDLQEVYRDKRPITTEDFTSEGNPDGFYEVWDTWYYTSIPLSEIDGGDPSTLDVPEWEWDSYVIFQWEDQTIESLPRWEEPTGVYTGRITDNQAERQIEVVVILEQGEMLPTRWNGKLTLTIMDSLDNAMYGSTEQVSPSDFEFDGNPSNARDQRSVPMTFITVTIPYDLFIKSLDRSQEGKGLMLASATFEWDGKILRQEYHDRYFDPTQLMIPDALMVPKVKNLEPTAVLEGPTSIFVGFEEEFSAEGSGDKDGEIVRFNWDWSDGVSDGGAFMETINRTFDAPGEYTLTLEVVDDEDATATQVMVVTVEEPFIVTFVETGVISIAGDDFNKTFLRIKYSNISPYTYRRPAAPSLWVKARSGGSFNKISMEGTIPVEFGPGQITEVTVYYEKYDGLARIGIDITSIELWKEMGYVPMVIG